MTCPMIYKGYLQSTSKSSLIELFSGNIIKPVTELIAALTEKGFFEDEEPRKLVVCGDLFDRGSKPKELQKFIIDLLDKDEVILIRGNHEDLAIELVRNIHKWMAPTILFTHHWRNGTVDTILKLSGMTLTEANNNPSKCAEDLKNTPFFKRIIPAMVDYFETNNYIFVHGWIPCDALGYGGKADTFYYKDNWREVDTTEWNYARWYNGIVFKSSYTLNRLDICKDIHVWNCKVKSRCNAIKFGTETNGGFENILIENIDIRETRITGISIESVDGAIVDGVTICNVKMTNVNAPIFVHIGKRMRGPVGREVGKIKNVTIENITAEGPYEEYEIMPWNYFSYKANDTLQKPWIFGIAESFDDTKSGNTKESDWQMTSNVCGLKESPLENIILRNVHLKLDGGVKEYKKEVPEEAQDYPEVFVYGRILPAKGIYFRHINGLALENVKVETYRQDTREDFVFENVNKAEKK